MLTANFKNCRIHSAFHNLCIPNKNHTLKTVPTLTTLIRCPMALAGRLLPNLARTMPLLPCARVTFPQITLVLLGFPPGVTVFL